MESLGRNDELESLGYYGKQCYWIRCVDCVEGCRHSLADDSEVEAEPEELRDQEEEEGGEGEEEKELSLIHI